MFLGSWEPALPYISCEQTSDASGLSPHGSKLELKSASAKTAKTQDQITEKKTLGETSAPTLFFFSNWSPGRKCRIYINRYKWTSSIVGPAETVTRVL